MNYPYLFQKKLLFFLLSIGTVCSALDRAHFYSTCPMWEEPRFEKDYLGSFDVTIFTGSACEGHGVEECNPICSQSQYETPLLDIYGRHNMHLLGENVPGKDLTLFTDITLTNLSLIPSRNEFGHLSFCGKFENWQTYFTYTQNIKRGFFFQIDLPVRSLEISCIGYRDLSPSEPEIPNINNPTWQSFLTIFDDILTQYNLNICDYKCTHVGDLSLLLGWTKNHEKTEVFDFVDVTIKGGVLCPTGAKRNPNKVFSLPNGYDGHWGFPFSFDIAFGAYEWLTMGVHLETIILTKKAKELRMKTALGQSGFIKLAKGCATVRPGPIVRCGLFAKADHFAAGLSFLIAYSYARKGDDRICPSNTQVFSSLIAESDEMFREWKMHTVHFKAEYDFTRENSRVGTRFGIFYNVYARGQRTFQTSTVGANVGFDVSLDF